MNSRIVEYAKALDQVSRERRRDFHRFAETAWLEMRTSAIISKVLTELGYEVVTGRPCAWRRPGSEFRLRRSWRPTGNWLLSRERRRTI